MDKESKGSKTEHAHQEAEVKTEDSYIDIHHKALVERALQSHCLIEKRKGGVLVPWQPLYLNQDGRPFVPGTIVKRSDLPSYFMSSPDKCINPESPNLLLLQDIYHVNPESAEKHIEFAQDFTTAAAVPAKIKEAVVSNSSSTLKCSKSRYDELGKLEVTSFGCEYGSFPLEEEQNNCLHVCAERDRVLAVFQSQDTWPEKGDNNKNTSPEKGNDNNNDSDRQTSEDEMDEEIDSDEDLKTQRFMFVGYYCVKGWGTETLESTEDFVTRFQHYDRNLLSRRKASHLFRLFINFQLKLAFSYELSCESLTNDKSAFDIIFTFDMNKDENKIAFPAKDLLEIQKEIYSGVDISKPRDNCDREMLPRFAAGETDLLDTLRYRIFLRYLVRLSDLDLKPALRSIQP